MAKHRLGERKSVLSNIKQAILWKMTTQWFIACDTCEDIGCYRNALITRAFLRLTAWVK